MESGPSRLEGNPDVQSARLTYPRAVRAESDVEGGGGDSGHRLLVFAQVSGRLGWTECVILLLVCCAAILCASPLSSH